MRKNLILASAAAGALALSPAAATARSLGSHAPRINNRVVLFRSVGGVPLGITPAAVVKKLGPPSHTIKVGGKVAEYDYYTGEFQTPIINVSFDNSNPRNLDSGVFGYVKTLRTPQGIHPGSTVAALKRAYKGKGLKSVGGSFTLYQGTPGAVGYHETDFGTTSGKIVDIGIQTAFDDVG